DNAQARGVTIHLETKLEEGLPELYGDESDICGALVNLVFNSIEALPRGGWIRLSVRAASFPNSPEAGATTHLIFEVSDSGVGMDEETRQKCAEPFFSTKRHGAGAGLGLAMVYGTVERHEGRIEIQSKPNEGTTVRLILPLRKPSKDEAASVS